MKKIALLMLFLLPFAGINAKEYRITTDREIQAVVNSSEADVELIYTPSGPSRVVYSSPEASAPLKVSVNGSGRLVIETQRKKNYKVSTVKVYHSGRIADIVNSGTGDIETKSINAPVDLKITNSGTGDIDISALNVKSVRIVNSGTGDVDIDGGKTVDLRVINSGTGDVKAKVISADSEISNSGTGDVTGVRASSKRMKLSNCGTGKIVIKEQKIIGDIQISSNCDRNIRFVK